MVSIWLNSGEFVPEWRSWESTFQGQRGDRGSMEPSSWDTQPCFSELHLSLCQRDLGVSPPRTTALRSTGTCFSAQFLKRPRELHQPFSRASPVSSLGNGCLAVSEQSQAVPGRLSQGTVRCPVSLLSTFALENVPGGVRREELHALLSSPLLDLPLLPLSLPIVGTHQPLVLGKVQP